MDEFSFTVKKMFEIQAEWDKENISMEEYNEQIMEQCKIIGPMLEIPDED